MKGAERDKLTNKQASDRRTVKRAERQIEFSKKQQQRRTSGIHKRQTDRKTDRQKDSQYCG